MIDDVGCSDFLYFPRGIAASRFLMSLAECCAARTSEEPFIQWRLTLFCTYVYYFAFQVRQLKISQTEFVLELISLLFNPFSCVLYLVLSIHSQKDLSITLMIPDLRNNFFNSKFLKVRLGFIFLTKGESAFSVLDLVLAFLLVYTLLEDMGGPEKDRGFGGGL